MSTITRQQVRHSANETDAAKIARVEVVAREWQRLVRWQTHRLRAPELIGLAARPHSVVKAFRASPERAQFARLNSHLQQEAISHACAIVSGGWEQAATTVRGRIGSRRATGRISDVEAHELHWLLRWPSHLATVLGAGVVVPDDERLATNDHARLDRWLRAALLRARPGSPSIRHARWFSSDAMTYRASLRPGDHFPAWISLPTLERGKPVRIPWPVAGSATSRRARHCACRSSVTRTVERGSPCAMRS